MTIELALPKQRMSALAPPSRIALDMAFGVGAGAVLGDKSRYNAHGAITTATWAAGLHGYCLNFVAANPDYVVVPAAHTQLDFTSEDFSCIARIHPIAALANQVICNRGQGNADGYEFDIDAAGRVYFITSQFLARQISQTNVGEIVAGNRYTVGYSRAGAVANIYINGINATTVWGVHIDPLTCARHATIGIRTDLVGRPFDGRIEFLRIFRGVALQPTEHLAWHNALA